MNASLLLAATVMLAWNPNSEPDLAGYKLNIGIQSIVAGNPPVEIRDVGNVTQHQVDGLDYGTTYFFTATAYNQAGLESGHSNEVTYTPTPPVEDRIRYRPRSGWNGRMNGGYFEAAQSHAGLWVFLGWSRWWPSYGWNELVFPPGTFARYKVFRYVGRQSNVAELEWIQNGRKLTGTIFGTPGSWRNYGATIHKAFDGNPSTYWDAPAFDASNHAGIDTTVQ
jgi:hypothetical protein